MTTASLKFARKYLRPSITKLQLWSMTQYDQVLFIDADVFARRSVDDLFQLLQPRSPPGNASQVPLLVATPSEPIVSSGVMLFWPNERAHRALVRLMMDDVFPHRFQDQATIGFLFLGHTHPLPCADHVSNLDKSGSVFLCRENGVTIPDENARLIHWASHPKPFDRLDFWLMWKHFALYWEYLAWIRTA